MALEAISVTHGHFVDAQLDLLEVNHLHSDAHKTQDPTVGSPDSHPPLATHGHFADTQPGPLEPNHLHSDAGETQDLTAGSSLPPSIFTFEFAVLLIPTTSPTLTTTSPALSQHLLLLQQPTSVTIITAIAAVANFVAAVIIVTAS